MLMPCLPGVCTACALEVEAFVSFGDVLYCEDCLTTEPDERVVRRTFQGLPLSVSLQKKKRQEFWEPAHALRQVVYRRGVVSITVGSYTKGRILSPRGLGMIENGNLRGFFDLVGEWTVGE